MFIMSFHKASSILRTGEKKRKAWKQTHSKCLILVAVHRDASPTECKCQPH